MSQHFPFFPFPSSKLRAKTKTAILACFSTPRPQISISNYAALEKRDLFYRIGLFDIVEI